eukprot:scaffold115887_cov42-Prasinocladus_malaysianus.AAC.1
MSLSKSSHGGLHHLCACIVEVEAVDVLRQRISLARVEARKVGVLYGGKAVETVGSPEPVQPVALYVGPGSDVPRSYRNVLRVQGWYFFEI